MTEMLRVAGLSKRFVLHLQDGAEIHVLANLSLTVAAGERVVLTGHSGSGKSSLIRMIYANYLCPEGEILVRHDGAWIDIAAASPHEILEVRRRTIGYVSQFLRVVPRVPALEIVAAPMLETGRDETEADRRARSMLTRLGVPERLWSIPPGTFSGGEQQRVNLARAFAMDYPILLLDEPTASLDPQNRDAVIGLILEAARRGAAVVGIFHDADVRAAVATRQFDVERYRGAA